MAAGPIVVRELLVGPRRPRFYLARVAYASLLLILAWTAWQALVGFGGVQRSGDYAHFFGIAFPLLARVQLALAMFGSALFGATALSHEKDRRTL